MMTLARLLSFRAADSTSEPLALASLDMAGRDIVEDHVAAHRLHRITFFYLSGGSAYDYCELRLAVHALIQLWYNDCVGRPGKNTWRLCKKKRLFRRRLALLEGMIKIIEPHTHGF